MRYQRRPGEHLSRAPYTGPIPRIRVKQLEQSPAGVDQFDQYEACTSTVRQKRNVARMDTFRENAIETIYDEFRFLDETDAPSPTSSAHPIVNPAATESRNGKRRFTPSLIAYCLLPLIQLTISIGLALLAIVRLQQLFEEPLTSNSLVDFDKPEGLLPIDERSSRTLKIRSAISVLIPAAFQCIGAVAGFGRWQPKTVNPIRLYTSLSARWPCYSGCPVFMRSPLRSTRHSYRFTNGTTCHPTWSSSSFSVPRHSVL